MLSPLLFLFLFFYFAVTLLLLLIDVLILPAFTLVYILYAHECQKRRVMECICRRYLRVSLKTLVRGDSVLPSYC